MRLALPAPKIGSKRGPVNTHNVIGRYAMHSADQKLIFRIKVESPISVTRKSDVIGSLSR